MLEPNDDDAPPPLPSWLPEDLRHSTHRPFLSPPSRQPRVLAYATLVLGLAGVIIVIATGSHTELLLGALLVMFGLRVLLR
jgi:hypothetical protein